MKLPRLPGFGRKPQAEPEVPPTHFTLRISQSYVHAVIWQISANGAPQIVCRSRYATWDGKDLDALIKTVDQALSECTSTLPKELPEPNDVLLGLPGDWVDDGQLLSDYRQVLKQLTSSLDLKAMGFVVTSEAIVHLMNSAGTGAVSGILVGVEDEVLEVSLVIQGHIQQLVTFPHQQDVISGLLNSLQQLEAGHLPPKIILYDGETDLTHLQQALLQQDWETAPVGFLHLPEVMYLPEHVPTESIVYSAQRQTLAQAQAAATPPMAATEVPEADWEQNELEGEVVGSAEDAADKKLAEVGFVRGKDIREMPELQWEEDLAMQALPTAAPAIESEMLEENQESIEDGEEHDYSEEDPVTENPAERNNQRVAKVAQPHQAHTPVIAPPKLHWRFPWKIALIVLLVLGFLGGAGAYAMSMVKAELTLYVEPQLLEKELQVTVNPEVEQSDLAQKVLKGALLSTRVTGTTSIGTTGKTLVGEKAKGDVTIFNDTDTLRTLPAGTVLTAQGKQLKFTLDKETTIASKSVDLSSDSPFKPGQAKVAVTAAQIGPDYNLEAQAAFTVANFSSNVLLARADKAFTGGSSREIQAVAQTDLTKLVEQLKTNLEGQAKTQLGQQLDSKQQLIDSSVMSEWVQRKFSHKVGEETNSVSLDGELKLEGIAYSESDFYELAKHVLEAEAPTDKKMTEQISTQFKLVENKESTSVFTFDVVTKTYLLPVLDPAKISEKVAGRRPKDVEGYLTNLPAVKEAALVLTPRLPEVLKRYPFATEKITVKIVPQT